MATLYTHQSSNIAKTWFFMSAFLILIIGLGWYISYAYNNPGILYIFAFFSVIMNIVSYWYSDKIVLSMYKAILVTNESHPDLYNVVENLSITAGLPMPKVYVIPDQAPNAFATGRNKDHAAVAVTQGLLQMLSKTELEGVIAHEMAHIGNRDTLIATVVVVLVGFISILANFFLRTMHLGGGRDRDSKGGHPLIMIVGIIFVILSPIVATLIQFAISRKREYLADATGALMTRYPEGLASALEKISGYGQPMKRVNEATAHLFISNPFGPTKKLSNLFSTHPPVAERVKILRGLSV